jgi:hypothetical protein
LEYIRGRDEVHVTEHGLVRVLHVKINASTKALTVEELAGRRKTVVVGFLDTILNDISRDMDAAVEKEDFRARLAVDCQSSALQGLQNLLQKELFARHNRSDFLTTDWKPAFIQSIKDESAARAKVYKDKDSTWFASNAHLAKSVSRFLRSPRPSTRCGSATPPSACMTWAAGPTEFYTITSNGPTGSCWRGSGRSSRKRR